MVSKALPTGPPAAHLSPSAFPVASFHRGIAGEKEPSCRQAGPLSHFKRDKDSAKRDRDSAIRCVHSLSRDMFRFIGDTAPAAGDMSLFIRDMAPAAGDTSPFIRDMSPAAETLSPFIRDNRFPAAPCQGEAHPASSRPEQGRAESGHDQAESQPCHRPSVSGSDGPDPSEADGPLQRNPPPPPQPPPPPPHRKPSPHDPQRPPHAQRTAAPSQVPESVGPHALVSESLSPHPAILDLRSVICDLSSASGSPSLPISGAAISVSQGLRVCKSRSLAFLAVPCLGRKITSWHTKHPVKLPTPPPTWGLRRKCLHSSHAGRDFRLNRAGEAGSLYV